MKELGVTHPVRDFFRLNELNGKVKVTFDLALNLHLAKKKKSDDDA